MLAKLKERDPQAAASIGNLEGEHEGMAARLRRFANVVELVLKEQELSRKEFNHIASEFIDHDDDIWRWKKNTSFRWRLRS